ncbi:transmembrane protein 70 homolog, mitochondrial [Diabrotica virgifera virgifera]|uniref:Transmembrane protein 70 homolog, mitochondrial n=1 Tax=Diabrotica virgifera virgifera TaxID=50390 RepID=A0ABM5L5M1_DIAVI|nr:transmembrane protein 70 homolog, mitochondrial [Diabrotica virgifera virgifera]
MSIKSCIRVIPLLRNAINSHNSCLSRTINFTKSNIHRSTFSLYNKLDIRLYSTENKSESKEIYYGSLTPQIKAVKIFSLSSSVVGIIAQPFLYNEIASTGNVPVIVAAYTAIGFFTVVTPILLHLITKKYVTHLYYKPSTNSYIANNVNFFCLTKETEFTPEDVVVSEVPGMFTTFEAKGKALFVDPRLFEDPEHYAKIMGFDKPLDFKLYQTTDNIPSSSNKKD